MKTPALISDVELETITASTYLTTHTIANPSHMKDQPVWLFSGTKDTVVKQGVVDKLQGYYSHYGANIKYVNSYASEHAFPTDLPENKNQCDYLGKPYINNCNFDGVGDMFAHIIPGQDTKPLVDRDMDWQSKGDLSLFDQKEFVSDLYVFNTSSMDELGYVYIPHACREEGSDCRVHVAIHGCLQGRNKIDDTFTKQAGYLEWAASNNLIILFPQAKTNDLNPKGCWDFWGYTGVDYACSLGVQPSAIHKMVQRLQTKSASEDLKLIY